MAGLFGRTKTPTESEESKKARARAEAQASAEEKQQTASLAARKKVRQTGGFSMLFAPQRKEEQGLKTKLGGGSD